MTGADSGGIGWFDAGEPSLLRPLVLDCLAVPRWVDGVLAARPFGVVERLVAAADVVLSDDEVLAAIAHHPRIGERGRGTSAAWSDREQSGVDGSLSAQLAEANARYEARFGHVFLVCATGLSGADVLRAVEARMGNDPAHELRVVNRELCRIAAIRLRKLVHRD
ncbi:2-oxo-4-hydroxy-4-carboxy-5-ureidoimidazoline decarboxylase [Actinosynnema pretiosum subsp. pretiosum]|uniref:2-oxo-4-hydroxy-4-carboxy-5-ureidoimidazoline decarboxylase n=1 Tax=Actinosynnema pretiosum subsp. pretiosum TaxID=103721 RepID=A0AA45L3W2_9PSEU|nr:2-oxo-4-hydroxy-4-carboxy--5-ureidoimidazoline (OHCU) decarboxylase [Actinosynnema pretiosum subsp. pretiosum]QUF02916.1 2-oxo-4-hydroxy-4-carboxy-5-ureidoimidazoline decarboxylase [Actinosynnema pretiosum subsp. pretiosum]